MLLLPAHCLSGATTRVSEAMAILGLVGFSRTMRDRKRIKPEVEPIETDLDLLIRDIEIDILKAHCEIRMIDAILAFNQGLPFDSIFMKGLPCPI